MKALSQFGALVSFACFFIAGSWILLMAASSARDEGPIPACIGLCLIGTAFYLGPKLWLSAEAKASAPGPGVGEVIRQLLKTPMALRSAAIWLAVTVFMLMLGIAALRSKAQSAQEVAKPAVQAQ